MIKSVVNYPVSQLFDIEQDVVYKVPRYQREYTWGKAQWENLFDDIFENNPGYFLGSIICINTSDDALEVQTLEMVDGQQRLTTLSLLFAAIYKFIRDQKDILEEDHLLELAKLKLKLVLKKSKAELRVIPQIQNNNQDDYKSILSTIGVTREYETPLHAGNRRLYRSFYYFQDRIMELIEESSNGINTMLEMLDKINKASMVKIEVGSHADAYTLFESLNNRGMPLTAIDLIKNKLLAHFDSVDPGNVDYYFEQWNKLLNYLGDDYVRQERFFRQYYNAFKEELNEPFRKDDNKKKEPLGSLATRSNLIQIYEQLINYNAKNCLEKISEAGRLYAILLSRNQDDTMNGLEKPLKDLERIQGAPSYLLLLYLLVRRDALRLRNSHLDSIIDFLVRFFVRRNLTDIPPTRDLIRFFMTIVNDISDKSGEIVGEVIKNHLVRVSASDNIFRDKLKGPIYEENSSVTRFILCALAEKEMTKETEKDLWRVENRQFVWTIEHIFPQGKNIPESWVNMVADGDETLAKEYQETHVHKLGNLTISGFNSALSNKSFEEKRDRKDRKSRPVGYNNGLELNEDLAKAAKWSIEQIDERTDKLVDEVLDLFQLES
jgi:uncharacterized protein with ParB-like and HNH nuclease domain